MLALAPSCEGRPQHLLEGALLPSLLTPKRTRFCYTTTGLLVCYDRLKKKTQSTPPPTMATAEQIAQYAEQGFVVVPDVLSSEELTRYRTAVAAGMRTRKDR